MKVLVVFYKHNTLWKKTALEVFQQLHKHDGLEVKMLEWSIPPLLWKVIRLLQRPFFNNGMDGQDIFFRKVGQYYLKKRLTDEDLLNEDAYLFICHYVGIPYVNGNVYHYVDATLPKLAQYIKGRKLFKKAILKKYVQNKIDDYRNVTAVFTQNEWTKESTIQDFRVDRSRVFNIHFGVNLRLYDGEKDFSSNLLLIVIRKGTEQLKGLDLLLQSFPLLKKRIPNVKLAVVGAEGESMEGVEYYYDKGREKTVELFQQSTLYVMPASHEPNGVTYLEALANKTPIVGLNRFSFPEFSGNGEYGFICKDDKPESLVEILAFALSDKERLKEMGEKGQVFVAKNYIWEKVVGRMVQKNY